MNRRESRETAFYLVFEWGFRQDEPMEDVIALARQLREIPLDEFAVKLARTTAEHCADLDGIVEQYSQKWKLNRIPRVTLAVLRLAFCEMTQLTDIPVGATINEAVELLKKYATEDDAAYVNGLLGQFERDRSSAEPEESRQQSAEQH